MWDGFELPGAVAHEMRGFGSTPLPATGEFSHAADLEERLGGEPAALVGSSFGGGVCLELAARRPDLVERLVLLDAPLPDHDWSQEILDYAEREEELIEEGEHRAAAEWNADFWLSAAAPPEVRARVIDMQERAFELQSASDAEEIGVERIDLEAVRARTLIAVGALDLADFHRIAERLHVEIGGSEPAVIEHAGHLPALERPAATAELVRSFLLDNACE